jgi:hypothetical protein
MGFKESVTKISDGTAVNAAVTNPCLVDLQNNDLYLKALIDSISGGEALLKKAVAFKSDVVAANPVYWNSANSRYELARDDGTIRGEVSGVCFVKTASTAGDLLTMGAKALDITPALQTADTLIAARYFLSTIEDGKLTSVRPSDSAIPVLIADGVGGVIVLPQTGNRGPRGYQGYIGSDGPRGYQGYAGPTVTTAAGSAGTTTTDSFVSAYDSGTLAAGLIYTGTIKNTGGTNGLTYRLTLTDAFGNTENVDANVAFGAAAVFNSHTAGSTTTPPFTRLQILVKSQSAGQATTFSLKLTRTAG